MKYFIEPILDRISIKYINFYNLEFNKNRYWRWSKQTSKLEIVNNQSTKRKITFSFCLKNLNETKNEIKIVINKRLIFVFDLQKEKKIDLNFTLQKGINTIEFSAKNSFIPKQLSKSSQDNRKLAFGIFDYFIDFIDYNKKNVILHGGFEKTGTTSLQKFLFENKQKLLTKKIYYLNMHHLNHWFLVTYCIDEDKNTDMVYRNNLETPEKRKLFKKLFKHFITQQIKSIASDINTIIISSEHFHSNINSLEETKRVKNFLKEFFTNEKIIFYLRRQDQLAVSHFSTRIKSGEYTLKFFPKNYDENYYNFYKIIKRWSNVFDKSNIYLKIFEKNKLKKQNIINDFFELINIDIENFDIEKYLLNKSLSASEIIVLLFINKYINGNTEWFKNKDKLSIKLISYFVNNFKLDDNTKILPSKQEALQFYDLFKKSNSLLFEEFFNSKENFSQNFLYPDNKMLQLYLEKNKVLENVIYTFIKFLNENKIIKRDFFLN